MFATDSVTTGDALVRCPYDPNHEIKASRLHCHILKCKKNHTELDELLQTCSANVLHRFLEADRESHYQVCPDIQRIQHVKELEKIMSRGCNTAVPAYTRVNQPPAVDDENWDEEIIPSNSFKREIRNTNEDRKCHLVAKTSKQYFDNRNRNMNIKASSSQNEINGYRLDGNDRDVRSSKSRFENNDRDRGSSSRSTFEDDDRDIRRSRSRLESNGKDATSKRSKLENNDQIDKIVKISSSQLQNEDLNIKISSSQLENNDVNIKTCSSQFYIKDVNVKSSSSQISNEARDDRNTDGVKGKVPIKKFGFGRGIGLDKFRV